MGGHHLGYREIILAGLDVVKYEGIHTPVVATQGTGQVHEGLQELHPFGFVFVLVDGHGISSGLDCTKDVIGSPGREVE